MTAIKNTGRQLGRRHAAQSVVVRDGGQLAGDQRRSSPRPAFIPLFGESPFEWLSALYRSIVDISPDAITVTSAEGKVLFCNQQASALHGFERMDEMVGRDAWDFVAPEDLNRAVEDFQRMRGEGAIHGVEYTLLRVDGKRTPVELSASAILDTDGNARAYIGIVRDVSERSRSEEALRRSEEYFRNLIESAPDLITVIEATGVIKYQSPSVERTLGYKPEELVGTNVWSLLNAEDARAVGEAMVRGLWEPQLFELLIFRVRHKNGEWRYLEGMGKLLTDENGRPYGVINSRDVTDRVVAEQALEESEKRKAAILDTALDAIITIDHESTVLEFNPAAEVMFGYTAAEAVGKPMDDLIVPPSLRARHRRGIKRYLASGDGPILGQRAEMTAMRADGTEFPAEIAIVPIQSEGPPVFTGQVRDLTERRRWDEELQLAREELDRKVEHRMEEGNTYGLTFRELTVLHLVARGKADKEIAVTLGISSQTVNKHVARILHKMGASSRTEAGVRAIKSEIVE
jgi:PAS domain S-box-containing protein